jgi:hypothetical protein
MIKQTPNNVSSVYPSPPSPMPTSSSMCQEDQPPKKNLGPTLKLLTERDQRGWKNGRHVEMMIREMSWEC